MLVSYFFTNATRPQRMSTQHDWPRAASFSTSAVTSNLQNWPPCTCTVWIVNAFLQILLRHCFLLDNRGVLHNAGVWEVSNNGWGPGQLCSVRWICKHLMRAFRNSEVCSWLFVYTLYTVSWPAGLKSFGIYFSSASVIFLCVLLRRKMLVGGERISQVLFVFKRVPHSEGRVFLVINMCICYVVSCFCYFLFVLLQSTLAWWKMETAVLFCLFSLLNSGMSWGAQYNLRRPVREINWHIQSNAGSISPTINASPTSAQWQTQSQLCSKAPAKVTGLAIKSISSTLNSNKIVLFRSLERSFHPTGKTNTGCARNRIIFYLFLRKATFMLLEF